MVDHYRMLTYLYDKSDPNYHNKQLKDKALADFAKQFNTTKARIKTWLQTNRRRFVKLCKKKSGNPKAEI